MALVNQYPARAAEFFYERIRAVLKFIKSDAQPLGGPVLDYAIRMELQRTGLLHAHILLWIGGVPDPIRDAQAYLRWIDSVISAEVPRHLSPEVQNLVRSVQTHRHTFTCKTQPNMADVEQEERQEIDSHVAAAVRRNGAAARDNVAAEWDRSRRQFWAERRERSQCRFGYPHPLCADTHFQTSAEKRFAVRGDRDVVMRRRQWGDRFINNYNLPLLCVWQATWTFKSSVIRFVVLRTCLPIGQKARKPNEITSLRHCSVCRLTLLTFVCWSTLAVAF